MRRPIIKFFDKTIAVLLGIVGVFTSHNLHAQGQNRILTLYGPPSAFSSVTNIVIKGEVKDKTTDNPIPNIRVIAEKSDTLYTNSQGKYTLKFKSKKTIVSLKFEDIDGVENGGKFMPQKIDINLLKKGNKKPPKKNVKKIITELKKDEENNY